MMFFGRSCVWWCFLSDLATANGGKSANPLRIGLLKKYGKGPSVNKDEIVAAICDLVRVAEQSIYPKPDCDEKHPWAVLCRAREAIAALSSPAGASAPEPTPVGDIVNPHVISYHKEPEPDFAAMQRVIDRASTSEPSDAAIRAAQSVHEDAFELNKRERITIALRRAYSIDGLSPSAGSGGASELVLVKRSQIVSILQVARKAQGFPSKVALDMALDDVDRAKVPFP